ncbi:MAG: TetR/AcrR family transcriptional regulator [Sinimarinibacterium flocculans]|uniref:TetR/AcrR family transcriptional regulator n=1 Tax=Sinimarinibacterium flocculans TaxID=985250 RepID=UPI003C569024
MASKNVRTTAAQSAPVETRQRILEAAIHCVKKWGAAKTSLNDIAREAGFTRPTVYSYFPSRDDVLVAALMHLAMEFGQRLLVHMKQFDTEEERYLRSLLFAVEELAREPFSTMIRGGDLPGYVGQEALPHPEGWKLVMMLFGQMFPGADPDRLEDLAEASVRLVLSHLLVRGHKRRSAENQRRFIRRSGEGLLHSFSRGLRAPAS